MTRTLAVPVPGGRRAFVLALLLGVLVAAHTLLETARDSLFLSGQPVSRLPWLYLAVTAVVLPITQLQSLTGRRRGGSGALLATLLCSIVLTLAFWVCVGHSRGVDALYVWSALFASIAFVQFWLVAVESFEVSEAKQVLGFVAAGGLVGAVMGNAVARLVLIAIPPRGLLLISAVLMIGAATLLRLTSSSARPPPQDTEVPVLRALPHHLWTDRYFRLLGLLALLPAVSAIFIDFLFKATVAAHTTAAQVPATVANAYLAQSVVALVVELVVARVLLRRAGVTRALLLLPLGLLAVGGGFLVVGGLAMALALRVVDSGLRPSLNRVGTELLYLPISPARRRLLKPSIDALGQRGGQALGSVVLLALLPLARATLWVSAVLLVATVGWIWVVHTLRPLYLQRFREQLGGGWGSARPPQLDLGAAEVLLGALGSPDRNQVLAALDLLSRGGRLGLIPALILYHPDAAVVRAALGILAGAGRPDVAAMLPGLLRHSDPEVRTAAAERWLDSGQDPESLRPLVADPHPRVQAAALVALSTLPSSEPELATMAAITRSGEPEERRELARAIADAPRDSLVPLLARLFDTEDIVIRREVLRAARRLPLPSRLLPALVRLLTDFELRGGARAALEAMGPPALEHLGQRLLDPSTPYLLDRELPAAVACFPSAQAAPHLLQRIGEPRGGASRFRSLRELNRLRRADPSLELDRALLERALGIELASALRNRQVHLQAVDLGISGQAASEHGALLLDMLLSRETLAVERAFRVLQLLFPDEALERVYLGTRSSRAAVRGAAIEVLVELLSSPWREQVLGLLTDPIVRPTGPSRPDPEQRRRLLAVLLGSSSPIVRLVTARIVAENGWVEALPALQAAAADLDGEELQVVLGAIASLEGGGAHAHG
ncbi:MAG TPA: HEAT repeat domain-containing protein [Myxococcaceae bacterium]|nr:HEAT repeat domain-containing protein [Myxococcaceae bacterium]